MAAVIGWPPLCLMITHRPIWRGSEFCSVETFVDISGDRFKFTDLGAALPPAFSLRLPESGSTGNVRVRTSKHMCGMVRSVTCTAKISSSPAKIKHSILQKLSSICMINGTFLGIPGAGVHLMRLSVRASMLSYQPHSSRLVNAVFGSWFSVSGNAHRVKTQFSDSREVKASVPVKSNVVHSAQVHVARKHGTIGMRFSNRVLS